MREIKFRGIKYSDSKFLYGYLAKHKKDPIIVNDVFQDNGYDFVFNFVLPETVGQFTGLKDKNGAEIYEGDIFHCNKVNYILKFNQVGGAYTVHKIGDEKDERFLFHCNDQIEIIGNIHENPELLN